MFRIYNVSEISDTGAILEECYRQNSYTTSRKSLDNSQVILTDLTGVYDGMPSTYTDYTNTSIFGAINNTGWESGD